MLQSVRRHSAIVFTVTVNSMQQIHPVDISPIKAQSQLIDYNLWGYAETCWSNVCAVMYILHYAFR